VKVMKRTVMVLIGIQILFAGAANAQAPMAPESSDARAGAWDRSVQLEAQGRIDEARDLLVGAWGVRNDSYEVTVRLAWLSLRAGKPEEAERLYRRARSLPGAGVEASQGLATCLTSIGDRAMNESDWAGAERTYRQALLVQPSHPQATRGLQRLEARPRFEPEVWGAYIHKPDDGPAWNGFAVFGHVRWEVAQEWKVRGAFRYMGLSRTRGAPGTQGRGSQGSEGWHQSEAYAGLEWSGRWVAVEGMGIGLLPSNESAVGGAAARGRFGRDMGLNLETAALRRDSGWNGQLLPTLYAWPVRFLGLAAGPRVTMDPAGRDVSMFAGVTLANQDVSVFLSGHLGTERWPFSISVPGVLTMDQDLKAGGTVAMLLRVHSMVRVGVQGQVERVSLAFGDGTWFAASMGLQWAPTF
jgi:hypothetical protein